MIDYHCHLLPGIDDGSPNIADSVAMAEQLAAAGFTRVHCTPHCISGLYDIPLAQIRVALQDLQTVLVQAKIPIELELGMEYYLDDNFFSRISDPQTFGAPLTLGDSDLLLFEMPTNGNFDLLRAAVVDIIKCGFTPLLAHPERYPYLVLEAAPRSFFRRLWRDRKTAECSIFHPVLAEIMQLGCLLQGDLGSFSGLYGPAAQHAANQHWARGHYYCFGSDGHNPQQLHQALAGLDVVGGYCRG